MSDQPWVPERADIENFLTDLEAERSMPNMDHSILGYCPLGCGQTLTVTFDRHIACSNPECPEPSAVSELLDDIEHEHIVQFSPYDFTIRHPLRERLRDELMRCALHLYLSGLSRAPMEDGPYRAIKSIDGPGWIFQEIVR